MASTPYDLNFKVERKDVVVCERKLTADDLVKFRRVGAPGRPAPAQVAGGQGIAWVNISYWHSVCISI